MFTRPEQLADESVAKALGEGWGLLVRTLEHVPVGFGSYHWRVDAGDGRWFATVDDLDAKRRSRGEPPSAPLRRLSAALSTARTLRDAGLSFVVAPERAASGDLVRTLGDRWALALYPFVEGQAHEWGGIRRAPIVLPCSISSPSCMTHPARCAASRSTTTS